MTVAELAGRSGLSVETVRYYARIGFIHPRRQKLNGYRLFDQDQVRRLV